MKVYSFIPPSPINYFDGNAKDFFNYLANNKGFPANSQNLISMFFQPSAMYQIVIKLCIH